MAGSVDDREVWPDLLWDREAWPDPSTTARRGPELLWDREA
ncbi:hypothetical protein [Streptomyces sp. NPDC058252]